MKKEKDSRKLMRVYIRPETEADIVEWAENQQNVGIAVKALIRMAIAVQGTRDILAMPFGVNALTAAAEKTQGRGVPEKETAPEPAKGSRVSDGNMLGQEEKPVGSGLDDIRSAFYGSSDDMDVFGTL